MIMEGDIVQFCELKETLRQSSEITPPYRQTPCSTIIDSIALPLSSSGEK